MTRDHLTDRATEAFSLTAREAAKAIAREGFDAFAELIHRYVEEDLRPRLGSLPDGEARVRLVVDLAVLGELLRWTQDEQTADYRRLRLAEPHAVIEQATRILLAPLGYRLN